MTASPRSSGAAPPAFPSGLTLADLAFQPAIGFQGFLFSPPLPIPDFERLLA
jgi:hypothetical protein